MKKAFLHNPETSDVTVLWNSEENVFPAESVKTIEYPEETIEGMVEHFIRGSGGVLVEVSAEEARELTSGKVGRPSEPKVAKAKGKGKKAEAEEDEGEVGEKEE